MNTEEILDVIDENNNVIDTATRTDVHKKGLLYRKVFIWLVTPDGGLIFQNRSKTKDTFPGLLDSTVGGHVATRMGYLESAIKEIKEEIGITVFSDNLELIQEEHVSIYD